ncbi:MAG: peptidyl-prolyl cis-trans isomerase [Gammaproteobacteria bacterium]|nr:peptidyl-prolyl cis-trans isomerase [Gammaproteobacteria bacterium]
MRLLKEPLIHFLFIGLILFASYSALNPDSDNSDKQEIIVDREALLNYLRYQNKAVNTEHNQRSLERMSLSQRQALIDAYVREEALFREAKALGLDQEDPVARQRTVRNLEYITTSFVANDDHVNDETIRTYFDEHKKEYFRPAEITFTHVFFSHESRGEKDAKRQAEQALQNLNTARVPFHKGLEFGDRFLYHTNYVNRQADEIAGHFGSAMQRQLFLLDVDEQIWKGPFTSPYGEHLVMVVQKKSGHLPAMSEIRDELVKDIQRIRLKAETEKAIQSVIGGYKVNVAEDLLLQRADDQTSYPDVAK